MMLGDARPGSLLVNSWLGKQQLDRQQLSTKQLGKKC